MMEVFLIKLAQLEKLKNLAKTTYERQKRLWDQKNWF